MLFQESTLFMGRVQNLEILQIFVVKCLREHLILKHALKICPMIYDI